MEEWEKGYPVDFSGEGDTTAVAIEKLIKELDKVYTHLNVLKNSIVPVADNSGVVRLTEGTGIFVVPEGITKLIVSCAAGGAGGSGGQGLGGGAGECVLNHTIEVTAGQEIAYSIGAGGLGCQIEQTEVNAFIGDFSGTDGADTTFGDIVLKGGKAAVAKYSSANTLSLGLAGGNGAYNGSMFYLQRIEGVLDKFAYNGGDGGSNLFGSAGKGGQCLDIDSIILNLTNGEDGQCPGTGGGGAAFVKDNIEGKLYCSKGGNGAGGILIIEMR